MIRKEGISLRKFILYSSLSLVLFLVSGTLLYIMNRVFYFNLFLSNFVADFVGLLIGFYVSKEKIFVYEPENHIKKIFIYIFLRMISILFFSFVAIVFYDIAIVLYGYFNFSTSGSGPHFITKALMIPFSLFLNFLISFFAIEFVHQFFVNLDNKI